MRWVIIVWGLWLSSGFAEANMVQSNTIGNDPAKEKLCASRVRVKGKEVPFEIDAHYLELVRMSHPDATFVAIDGMSPQLYECWLRQGTGKYEPGLFSPEQWYWHVIKPKQFEPGINTDQGVSAAAKICLDAAPAKINRPDFDHSVSLGVVEINIESPRYHPGALISGRRAERYDIVVMGTSFYKSSGPDLAAVNFTCLLSPMLDMKAIEFK